MLNLRNLIGIIILTFLCMVVAKAQSQGPPPSPGELSKPIQNHTTDKQKPSENNQRGTEQSPFIVKTINPPKTQTEIEQERTEREEKTANDRKLVWFTLLLVLVTAVLAGVAVWQGCQMRRSVDSMITSEKAYVFAHIKPDREIDITKMTEKDFVNDIFEFNAHLYLYNLGRTPAIIDKIAFDCVKSNTCPTKENLPKPEDPLIYFVGSNNNGVQQNQYRFTINKKDELGKIHLIQPTITYYCFGYVKYNTIFKKKHTHGFCFELVAPHGQFIRTPDSELNYDT